MADFTLVGNVIKAEKFGSFSEHPNSPAGAVREAVLTGLAPGGQEFEAVLHITQDQTGTTFDPLQSVALGQQITLEVTIS